MQKKKLTALTLSAVLTAAVLTGCGGKDKDKEADAGKPAAVSLTIWCAKEDTEMTKKMCESFAAANPDKEYSFKFAVVSEADAKKEVLKDISAAADIFSFASDQTAELSNAGALYRITRNRDKITSENDGSAIKAATVSGELYGYPYAADTYFMYYDKSKLTEEDIGSLEAILSKDIDGVTTNFAFDLDNGWYQSAFFFGAGCTLFGEDGNDPTKCDFNNERGLLVGEYLIDLVKNKKFGANFDDSLIKAGFSDGSIAAAVSGTWNAGDIAAALGENYGAAKLPTVTLPDGEVIHLGSMANYKLLGVSAETKFPLEAMALSEWLTNYDNQLIRFRERSFAPTNKALSSDTEALSENIAVAAMTEQARYATVQTSIPQSGNFWTPAEAFGQDLIAGVITRENLQQKLDSFVGAVLSKLA